MVHLAKKVPDPWSNPWMRHFL